jgi:hypothetical protein
VEAALLHVLMVLGGVRLFFAMRWARRLANWLKFSTELTIATPQALLALANDVKGVASGRYFGEGAGYILAGILMAQYSYHQYAALGFAIGGPVLGAAWLLYAAQRVMVGLITNVAWRGND